MENGLELNLLEKDCTVVTIGANLYKAFIIEKNIVNLLFNVEVLNLDAFNLKE